MTDLDMPQMGGIEMTKNLKKLQEEYDISDCPIFGMSGFIDNKINQKAKAIGMEDLYIKPLSMNTIKKIVNVSLLKGIDL